MAHTTHIMDIAATLKRRAMRGFRTRKIGTRISSVQTEGWGGTVADAKAVICIEIRDDEHEPGRRHVLELYLPDALRLRSALDRAIEKGESYIATGRMTKS